MNPILWSFGHLSEAKLKSMGKQIQERILTDVGNKLKENENIKDWMKEYEYEGRRLIVHYNLKRAGKDIRDRERLIERVEKKMKDSRVRVTNLVNNTGTKKYLKMGNKDNGQAKGAL